MARGTEPEGVDWLKLLSNFNVDEIALNNIELVKPVYASKYIRVQSRILGIPSALKNITAMGKANIKVGAPFDWQVLLGKLEKRYIVALRSVMFLFMNACSLE